MEKDITVRDELNKIYENSVFEAFVESDKNVDYFIKQHEDFEDQHWKSLTNYFKNWIKRLEEDNDMVFDSGMGGYDFTKNGVLYAGYDIDEDVSFGLEKSIQHYQKRINDAKDDLRDVTDLDKEDIKELKDDIKKWKVYIEILPAVAPIVIEAKKYWKYKKDTNGTSLGYF